MSAEPVLQVLLHHLTPDAAQAGADYPDLALADVPLTRLRELLTAFESIAGRVPAGASPEIRFKTSREMLIVRAAPDGLRLISWESPLGGSPLTAAQIADALVRPAPIARPERPEPPPDTLEEREPAPPFFSNSRKATVLLVVVLALNAHTLWRATHPPTPEFLPEYVLLPEGDGSRVLRDAAGEYHTGRTPGDRVVFLSPTGYLRTGVYGSDEEIREPAVQFARAARLGDRTFLLTSRQVPFEVKPDGTLELFGTVYRRR